MGLLAIEDGTKDYSAACKSASAVATLWNDYGGAQNGFDIEFGEEQVKVCCNLGSKILKGYFYNPPGPFKRLGGFLVLSQLFPFFGYKKKKFKRVESIRWLSRINSLLISTTLASLKMDQAAPGEKPKYKKLDAWRGFPSNHFKVEFLCWLRWLDSFDWLGMHLKDYVPQDEWTKVYNDRLARMFLATGLILEACYYFNECLPIVPNGIPKVLATCGTITKDPGPEVMIDLTFDGFIFQEFNKRKTTQQSAGT